MEESVSRDGANSGISSASSKNLTKIPLFPDIRPNFPPQFFNNTQNSLFVTFIKHIPSSDERGCVDKCCKFVVVKICGLERQSCAQGEHMTELAQPLDVTHGGVFDIGSHPYTIDAGSEVNIYPTRILDTPMAVCFATQI